MLPVARGPQRFRSRSIRSRSRLTFESDAARRALCSAAVCTPRFRDGPEGRADAGAWAGAPRAAGALVGVSVARLVARGSKKRLPVKVAPCIMRQS